MKYTMEYSGCSVSELIEALQMAVEMGYGDAVVVLQSSQTDWSSVKTAAPIDADEDDLPLLTYRPISANRGTLIDIDRRPAPNQTAAFVIR